MEILLQDQLLARLVERGVELRERLQRGNHRLDLEYQRTDFQVLVLFAELLAEGLLLGDVGVLVLGDVRDHRPVAREVGAGNLLDARQRLLFDLAELGEIDLRPRQQAETADRGGRAAGGTRTGSECVFYVGAHVVALDAAAATAALDLLDVHAQLARKGADGRAGVRCVAGHHDAGIQRRARGRRHIAFRCVARLHALAGDRRRLFFHPGSAFRVRLLSPPGRGLRRGVGARGRLAGFASCIGSVRRERTLSPALSRNGRGGRRDGCAVGFDDGDHGALGHLVAHLQLQLLHRTGKRRGHFHGGLVRFQRDQALFLFHPVADLDQHFDDGDASVADIGDTGFFEIGHGGLLQMAMTYRSGMAVADKASMIAKARQIRMPGAGSYLIRRPPCACVCMTLSARAAPTHAVT